MKNKLFRPKKPTLADIHKLNTTPINFKDIPDITPLEAKKIKESYAGTSIPVTIRMNKKTVGYFKQRGKGYQSYINHVLNQYVSNHTK